MDRLLPNGHAPCEECGSRSKFTQKEDQKLIKLVQESGRNPNWREISNIMQTRTPRQCRERYQNYLCPRINHKDFTQEEDELILKQFSIHGNKWNAIAKMFRGRTGNMIRNRWQTLIRKANKKKSKSGRKKHETKKLIEKPKVINIVEPKSAAPSQPNVFDALFTMMDYDQILNDDQFLMSFVGKSANA
ncbi:Myb-like DNA-binding domain containing protein [Trichomonas vaginalis G3]|uniref:Myb-like DNA-binding domain containing protein n=1 Tax=Trichomonas vaginalis (strain ATCC PRA-98 / G3) TaxID=412133 RepID=A2FIK5_TRIV3|nr:RNA polymerase II transcription regulator recruiting protein [Trichomonas vaginalis G3]EAX95254.1 Myb-like DNA-binding domain containing protein [Trichomonas vaginalis G3]KAI5531915.1 RNA polymerase II transcription regulator recruiting protein [Trichomonas vaginalis G3]|eukprot:XP_001308184.1 Myb-like DNA-binding domain containing protein [Trichomonas vaginalis G3]